MSVVKPSLFWNIFNADEKLIKCNICERNCTIKPGMTGFCGNYLNVNGELYNIGYGLISAIEPRPIEIKPLFHYYPGSWSLTFSSWSCNFKCPWCQNYHLSMVKPREEYSLKLEPRDLVFKAIEYEQDGLCASFNEPCIQPEFLIDVGYEARNYKLYLSIVTNGYMTKSVLEKLIEAGYTGFSIDIKGCPETYRKYLGANPEIIYRNAKYIIDNNCHVEMVYLVIPRVNDWEDCYKWIIEKHVEYLGLETPLHINRYYPAYRFNEPPTPIDKLIEIRDYAKREGLEYVYIGNTIYEEYQDTVCPKCGKVLITRRGYSLVDYRLTSENKCPKCGHKIPIFGEPRLKYK
ncbi:MAG: radical SAM protein [Desulfurococcaceae archaeon]